MYVYIERGIYIFKTLYLSIPLYQSIDIDISLGTTYIRFKWRINKSCLQHPEVDLLEERMRFYISSPRLLGSQPLCGVLGQQLQ